MRSWSAASQRRLWTVRKAANARCVEELSFAGKRSVWTTIAVRAYSQSGRNPRLFSFLYNSRDNRCGYRTEVPLLVCAIESPQKFDACRAALAGYAPKPWRIVSTFGRLYDLPSDELGITNTLEPVWVPVAERKLAVIDAALREAREIWVATDADDAGDWIAAQLLHHAPSGTPIFRVRMGSVDPQSLREAFDARTSMQGPALALPARIRRVVDRLIGYATVHPQGNALSPGRIRTTLCRNIRSTPLRSQPVRAHYRSVDGASWIAEIYPTSFSDRNIAITELRAFSQHAPVGPDPSLIEMPSPPLDTGSTILALADALSYPVKQIDESLQSLYQVGQISYPRTDESEVAAAGLQRLIDQAGYAGMPTTSLCRTADKPRTHGGIVTHTFCDPGDPLSRRGPEELSERVRAALFARLYWSRRDDVKLAVASGSDTWHKSRKIRWRYCQLVRSSGAPLPPHPGKPFLPDTEPSHALSVRDAVQLALLRRLHSLRISSPASLMRHASSLSRYGVDKKGLLQHQAIRMLNNVGTRAPALLEYGADHPAHRLLYNPGDPQRPENETVREVIDALALTDTLDLTLSSGLSRHR